MADFDIYVSPSSPSFWWPLHEALKPLLGIDGSNGSSLSTLIAAGEISQEAYQALKTGRISVFLKRCYLNRDQVSIYWVPLPAAHLITERRKIGYTIVSRARLERFMDRFLATSRSGTVRPLKEAMEQGLLANEEGWSLGVGQENSGFAQKVIPERYIYTDSDGCWG